MTNQQQQDVYSLAEEGKPHSALGSKKKIPIIVTSVLAVAALCAVVALAVSSSHNDEGNSPNTRSQARQPLYDVDASMKVVTAGGGGAGLSLRSLQTGPTIIRQSLSGDVDPYVEVVARFNNEFNEKFVAWANAVGITDSDGNKLRITKAGILGFPPTAIPTSGHVTHDFMTQTGGLHVQESVPISFDITDPTYIPFRVDSTLYKQDSSADAEHTISYSESFTSTQQLSVTEGISSSVSAEISVGVPDLGLGSKLSATMTASMSTTATNTESKTDTWATTETITIPAHSVTNATCYLSAGTINSPFSGQFELTGNSNIGWVFWDDRIHTGNDPWFWFFQTAQTGSGLEQYINIVGSGMSTKFDVKGTFVGVAGDRVDCEVHSCDYTPTTEKCYR